MSVCELLVPNQYTLCTGGLNLTQSVSLPLVSINGGLISVASLKLFKLTTNLVVLIIPGLTGSDGNTGNTIYTFSVIPSAYQPAVDYYQPITIVINGTNAVGTLHISPTGVIEWIGSFVGHQVNGWTTVCVIYPLS